MLSIGADPDQVTLLDPLSTPRVVSAPIDAHEHTDSQHAQLTHVSGVTANAPDLDDEARRERKRQKRAKRARDEAAASGGAGGVASASVDGHDAETPKKQKIDKHKKYQDETLKSSTKRFNITTYIYNLRSLQFTCLLYVFMYLIV